MKNSSTNQWLIPTAFPFLLVFYEVIVYLSNDAYLPILPTMGPILSTSDANLPFTLTIWFFAAGLGQLVIGPVCERLGRRPVLLAGGLIYVLSLLVCAASSSLTSFMIGRFGQGFTLATVTVSGYATIHDGYDRHTAIRTIAWMSAVMIIAPATGPLIGSGVSHLASWHWIFIGLACLSIPLLTGHYIYMPETLNKPHHSTSNNGYMAALSHWNYLGKALAACCIIFSVTAWLAAGPWIVRVQFNQPAHYFGIYQFLILLGFVIGTQLVSLLTRNHNPRHCVIACLIACLFSSFFALYVSHFYAHTAYYFIGAMVILSFSLGISFPILNRLTIEQSNAAMGVRVALFSTLSLFASVIATGIIGLVNHITTQTLSWVIIIGMFIALLLTLSTKTANH